MLIYKNNNIKFDDVCINNLRTISNFHNDCN